MLEIPGEIEWNGNHVLGGNFLKFEYASLVSRGFPLFRKHAVSFVTGIFHQMESALNN